MKVKRALISVSDKTGIVDFAIKLHKLGIEIISTGGTAKKIEQSGTPVIHVSDYTGYPEMLDGRVKTLHPKVEAGILADRDKPSHLQKIKEHDIGLIDLVAVNLYPFKKTISRPDATYSDAIENIDVGGPTLVRAAAKNHKHVAVIVDPKDYDTIIAELQSNKNSVHEDTLKRLAVKAFAHTGEYDLIIQNYLSEKNNTGFPEKFGICLTKAYDLRYGENSHQRAAFYRTDNPGCCVSNAKVLSEGKQLSFNNILDINAALELVKEFTEPAAVIIKHLNPSGVGVAENILDAYERAHTADTMSAFGCIVALNRAPDTWLAKEIISTFVEVLIAPSYTDEVLELLSAKKNMRVLSVGDIQKASDNELDCRKVIGGMLVQTPDTRQLTKSDLKVVSKRKPTKDEVEAMLFAWKVCRHTKSNSIIFAKKDHTVGVGAGQMSRVDAVKIAVMKAQDHAKGAVMASDAFFPFMDGINEAAKAGITAVIHPGGSIRDEEVIAAADEHDMAMVFTGVRCFLH